METDREEWGKKCVLVSALTLPRPCSPPAGFSYLCSRGFGIKRPGNETQQLSLCGALTNISDKSYGFYP